MRKVILSAQAQGELLEGTWLAVQRRDISWREAADREKSLTALESDLASRPLEWLLANTRPTAQFLAAVESFTSLRFPETERCIDGTAPTHVIRLIFRLNELADIAHVDSILFEQTLGVAHG